MLRLSLTEHNIECFKKRLLSAFVLVLLISAIFLFYPRYATATTPIRIGLTLSLTGRYSVAAEMQRKGFKLWQKEINSKGGLLGREVKLIIYDDKSNPEQARQLYERLIKEDNVDLVFSPYSSEITSSIAPIIERHGYPLIVSGASSDRLWLQGYRYLFGLYVVASRYTEGFLELLVLKGIDDLSIVSADDPFSLEVFKGTRKWAERLGLRIRHMETFKKGQGDLDLLARKAKESAARVLIVCGHLEESINMKKVLNKIGWKPIYYATVGPATEKYYEILGPDSEFTFSSSMWEPTERFKGSLEFYKSFKDTYDIDPTYHAATAYAAGQLLEEAVKRSGTINRERLGYALSRMETITIIGRYRVDKQGTQMRHINLIIQWQKGKKEIVWPKTLATAKPILR